MGIHLHCENKYEELLQILDAVYKYVPVKSLEEVANINGTEYKMTREAAHQILIGGDQLTTARIRGCQLIRMNSTTEQSRLSGLLSVTEDWHTKVVLLQVKVHKMHTACTQYNDYI